MMLLFAGITLPLEDPILKFLLILVIILAAPLLLNKLKIPYLLGLIIAGAVIGPHGLNLVLRDSSIILSGTAGLLYIMFLSGLDMDMSDFRKNGTRSLVFGLYTFCVPLLLGILAGYYILGFSIYSSILLAGLFASQTLIAYPIVSKLGIARDKAVTIAVGGTVITDTLALLLLTVIVGMVTGNTDDMFWYRLGISVVLCIAFIMLLFPLIGHWFFKHCSDNISQYIFVLVMVFLGAYLAHLAGLEPIIGAFLAGLALNRLIPRTSPLMNRIEFVGNAIFIPFFLIGVGMLIDYRAFFRDWESIKVAAVMIVLITAAKYIAGNFSDMGYAVTMQPVSGGNVKKGAAIYNILVYKPGLYSNNQSIVVGANYDSSGQRNNGSGTALLLETARGLKDIPTNHNIYFVAYANGAKPAGKSISSGACVHASTLSGSIGATNILGMINLEPQKLDAGGERKQPGPESSREAVLFTTTPHGKKFAGQCAAPFAKSWEQAPTTFHREPSALTGNDRHYAVLGIPTVSCRSKYPVTDARTEEYVQALTDMIHQVADNDAPEPAKNAGQGEKAS